MQNDPVCGSFDWIVDFEDIRQFLTPEFLGVDPGARLLVVGCGTSTLSERLHATFPNVVSVDIDERQVDHMRQAHAGKAGMSWVVADLCDARGAFPIDGVFDVAVDKGTLDALLCTDQASQVTWPCLTGQASSGIGLAYDARAAGLNQGR